MSSLHAKIENICRLCLSGDDTLESIFGDSGSDALQTIIYDCTSIRIQPQLGLPSSICSTCKSKVENFNEFRERCLHNDEYLRTTLQLVAQKQEEHDDEYEEDDEEDVDIKLEPEVLLDEQSDVDQKEDDGKEDDMIVDRNDNKIDRTTLAVAKDRLNGQHELVSNGPERDEWDEAGSNDHDSLGNSSTESLNYPYLSPDPTYGSLLKCEFCSLEFSVLEQLKRHITSHKEERIFQCYYCPKTFHFAKNLNMHVEYIHSKAKYTPSQVAKMIARQQSLVHSSSSNNSSVSQSTNGGLSPLSPLLDTSDCLNNNTIPSGAGIDAGAGLSLNINLNGSTTSSSTNGSTALGRNLKPIRLPALGLLVTEGRRGSTIQSTIGLASERQQHECHVCHKSYGESSALRQHMLVHTGEKPYKCDICSKSFYNASTLKTHQRIHSDQNPYRCGTCTKMFDNARSLELHHRTHTGEKPYACDVCLKKFSCSSNLKRHRKLHDRD
ncbi:zinc finger protein 880-like [Anopheles marshallii]|uniref:zinc finger protein 880-like n=1 Tax=Anopheles marshallii TaxID=1521116 RepID=UPI00237AD514|nr:zinc finger protein 880-like [Anopheles marshallii]